MTKQGFMRLRNRILGFVMGGALLMACGQSEYALLESKELASGVRQDSLIMELYFGDLRKDFFKHCWELNKKGLISHGPDNQNVQYNLEDKEGKELTLLFYPKFDTKDRIKRMDMEFIYKGWAPWNEHLYPDKLLPQVKEILMDWYKGNEFILVELDDSSDKYWVKVDGNRRISLGEYRDKSVSVRVTDLLNEDN